MAGRVAAYEAARPGCAVMARPAPPVPYAGHRSHWPMTRPTLPADWRECRVCLTFVQHGSAVTEVGFMPCRGPIRLAGVQSFAESIPWKGVR